jgi:hypothetical protein
MGKIIGMSTDNVTPINKAKPFKRGDGRKKGRPQGAHNVNTQMLKDALLLAAEQVGEIKRVPILDEYGKPTGEYEFEYSGVDGLLGYLRWAAINRPASFLALLGRVLPLQLNIKSERSLKVTYKTVEETRAALKERGIEPSMVAEILQLPVRKPKP